MLDVLLVAAAPPQDAGGSDSREIWIGRKLVLRPEVAPPRKPWAGPSNPSARKSSRTMPWAAGPVWRLNTLSGTKPSTWANILVM
jgi:hypothetical protein